MITLVSSPKQHLPINMQHTVPNSKIVLSLLTKTIIELGEMKWKENHMKENSL